MNYLCRSTVGVFIGVINILGFTGVTINIIIVLCDFGKLNDEDMQRNYQVISKTVTLLYIILIICFIAIILSSLLIAGIIKKCQLLMIPWLICAAAGIICHTFRLAVGFLSGLLSQAKLYEEVLTFLIALPVLGIQILIFYLVYELYKIIRDMQKSTQSIIECEENILNKINDNPPSYGDLERNGQLSK